MSEPEKTRFGTAEEALRFYFRVRELVHGEGTSRLAPDELPADACAVAANAIDDYQCIGWCMRGLDEVALWLLGEIYRPTGFGVQRRTFSQASRAGRLEFPERHLGLRELRAIHEHALGAVKRGLRLLGMIPARQPHALRERHRRLRTVGAPAHLPGREAANRG